MREVKTVNLNLDTYGNYLGMEKGCIILRDRNRKEKRYPLFEQEIGEVVLKSGNMVSTGVLSALGFWGIDVLVTTRNDRPIAILKNLEDDAHVKTRIDQIEAIKNGKGITVAKRIVLAKALGQSQILKKYGLRQHDTMKIKEATEKESGDLATVRRRLTLIESHYSKLYFGEIFQLMAETSTDLSKIEKKTNALEEDGKTVMFLVVDAKLGGIIAAADTLKEHARDAVEELKKMDIEIVMLTGDNERTAKSIAKRLGIERVLADVLPQQKEALIERLQNEGKTVAMVGDGINDAPALAKADVGIAIGSGTDIAKETGGIVLVKEDLRDVVIAIKLSKSTVRKIKQNLFWAFAYNSALIPIAAGALVPFFGAQVYTVLPFLAAGAMAFSSVTVVSNSLLLERFKPDF